VLSGDHQRAIWFDDTAKFPQRADTVVYILEGERAQREVKRCVRDPVERIAKVMDPEVSTRNSATCQTDHPLALIESDDGRTSTDQVGSVKAGTARGIEDSFASEVPQQAETGWAVVVRVVEAVDRVIEEGVCERFVLWLPPHLITHGTNHRAIRDTETSVASASVDACEKPNPRRCSSSSPASHASASVRAAKDKSATGQDCALHTAHMHDLAPARPIR
jgi:hypothetical protein